MSISEKLYSYNEENYNVKFTNEDHINSHQKKHSMSFDLELDAKTIKVVDETPTPTSFFRNCEEVGLFQDLQNVNPFEETFKKALENCDSGANKLDSLSLITCEESLHTPHIFPTSAEAISKPMVTDAIVNILEIPQIPDKIEILSGMDSNMKLIEKHIKFRYKLKEALLRKDRKKYIQSEPSLTIDLLEPANLVIADRILHVNEEDFGNKDSNCIIAQDKIICGKLGISSAQKSSIEKVREMNRAAQIRCRNKKKKYYDRVAKELINLKKENVQLKEQNVHLRQKTVRLWKIIEELGGIKEAHSKTINVKIINENIGR